jgi:Flp pilus assembly CpaE family ATPase
MVLELSVPSIRAARRALDVFERLRYTAVPGRIRLVVNRYSGPHGFLSLDELAETLGTRPYHAIENDYARVFAAVNAGRPVCLDSPETPAARDLSALAAMLLDRDISVKNDPVIRRGLFGRKVAR